VPLGDDGRGEETGQRGQQEAAAVHAGTVGRMGSERQHACRGLLCCYMKMSGGNCHVKRSFPHGDLPLSRKELQRPGLMKAARSGRITTRQAAQALRLSLRQVRRRGRG
jgi:hypothetical protein